MIYPENFIYDMVSDVLKETYEGIWVSGYYTQNPAKFPAVILIQADSADYLKARTAEGEQAAKVMYEANVYSNLTGYKKAEAYRIMGTIDDVMTGKIVTEGRRAGFQRTMCAPVANLQDTSIYKLVARWEGVIDEDFMIYVK